MYAIDSRKCANYCIDSKAFQTYYNSNVHDLENCIDKNPNSFNFMWCLQVSKRCIIVKISSQNRTYRIENMTFEAMKVDCIAIFFNKKTKSQGMNLWCERKLMLDKYEST